MVDHTAEIVTLRQQLAAAAARTRSRHNATAADKGNVKLLTTRPKALQRSTRPRPFQRSTI